MAVILLNENKEQNRTEHKFILTLAYIAHGHISSIIGKNTGERVFLNKCIFILIV